jgi:hypothetical protein
MKVATGLGSGEMSDNWLSYVPTVADWASIVSLFISAYAAYAITKVRSQVIDRVRLPPLIAVFQMHAKNFAKLMRTYDEADTKDEFAVELAKCEANLRLVRSKVNRQIGNHVRAMLVEITKYKRPRWFGYYPAIDTREHAWTIYSELNGLIEELTNFVEEKKMGA